jgi:hypothetical protein
MQKVAPYLTNGFPKICWGCGKPFVVRGGQAEAIVGLDGRLYCYRNGCDDDAYAFRHVALKRAS